MDAYTGEEILNFDIPDEALERAASARAASLDLGVLH
jgi:hypothetical protein